MQLGAVSHFNQQWPTKILPFAQQLGVGLLRDGVRWSEMHPAAGRYVFEGSASLHPEMFAEAGLDQILLFGRPLAHADGGKTPHTDAGRAEFADFVAAVLERFPEVGVIEIGNEFNGQNFVEGPVKKAGYGKRDAYYVDLLKAVHDRIADEFPDVKILGGATHSVPVGYLRDTFERGALDHSDGLAIHPYTSEPEQLGVHLAILRAAMGGREQPIYVTEFGQNFDALDEAPAYLAKMVAVMSAAGVEAATWYALREQRWFPNMELMDFDGNPTPAGEAFAFMQSLLARGDAVDVSPDDLTYAFRFGKKAMMIWGAARDVELAPGAVARSADGRRIDGPLTLSEDEPLIVTSGGDVRLGDTVRLGEAALVGDSFHQFDVTNARDGSASFEGPWSWHERRGDGRMAELVTNEGGDRPGDIWKPHLDGGAHRRPLMVSENNLRPVDFSDGKKANARFDVVERFTAPEAMTVTIDGQWDVGSASTDGVDLTVTADGREIWSGVIRDRLDLDLEGVALEKGDALDFTLGVNKSSKGDLTERRIRLLREDEPPSGSGAAAAGDAGEGREPDPAGRVVGERGSVVVGTDGVRVALGHRFEEAVMIASIAGGEAGRPEAVRVRDVGPDGFELVLDEPDHLDGRQSDAQVSWLAVEAGRWTLGDGLVLEAGTTGAGGGGGPFAAPVSFGGGFDGAPAVFTQVQTENGPEFVWTRSRDVGPDGFEVILTEEEAQRKSGHETETVGWLAVERGAGAVASEGGAALLEVGGTKAKHKWKSVGFDEAFEAAPHLFGGVGARGGDPVGLLIDRLTPDGARLRVQEDRSLDDETRHTAEAVDWLALSGDGFLFAA